MKVNVNMTQIVCISQARMRSSRLPRKVLSSVAGKPLLKWHIERVQQSNTITKHIIATSDNCSDDAIEDFCAKQGVPCFRGSENNVLSRFARVANELKLNEDALIIRLTADCPLVDAALLDNLVEQHIANNPTGISNIDIHHFPRGFDVEVFSAAMLNEAAKQATTLFQKEHVTPYIYQQYGQTLLSWRPSESDQSHYRLCIDEPDDLAMFETLIEQYPDDIMNADAHSIIAFLNQHVKIAKINQHVQQKQH